MHCVRQLPDDFVRLARALPGRGRRRSAARTPDGLEEYDTCSAKIKDSGKSILVSAHQLIKLGIPKNPKKNLPEPEA